MTEQRHTVDSITSDALDALQDEVSYLQQLSAEQGQALTRACSAREEQRARAKRAEADRDRVQLAACRTAETLRHAEAEREHLRTLARTHWDAIERVRAELHALNSEVRGLVPVALAGRRDAVSRIRAVLDQPQQPTA